MPWPSVLVTARSPCRTSVSVSVELLLAGFRSMKFAGGVTVAVLTSVVADVAGLIVPVTVNTAVPFFGTVTSVLMFPTPFGAPLAPPA